MDCMNAIESEHPFAKEVKREVQTVKNNERYRAEYFSWNAKAQDLERKGRREGIQQGIQQGIRQGVQVGSNVLADLYGKFKSDGRDADAERLMTDSAYREQMIAAYDAEVS